MKENWKYKKLGEVCKVINGLWTGKNPPFINVAVIRNTNFSKDCKLNLSDVAYIDVEEKQFKTRKLQYGDIIIEKSGGSDKQSVGRAVYFDKSDGNYSFSNFTSTLRVINSNEINPSFLQKVLFSKYNNGVMFGLQSKTTGLHNLDMKGFLNLPIPVPPLPVQQQIVAELDLLSDIIEKQKQQITELDKLARATFYDMFGDPVTNEKGWEVKRLKDCVIEMFLGPFGSALKTDSYVDKNNAYCMIYEQKHAIRKTLDVETHYIDKEKHDSLKRFEVHSGDFIMSCRGTIGEIFRLPNEAPMGIIHPSLMKIRIKEDIFNSTFFLWLLSWIIKNENTNGNCVQMAITAKELGTRTPIVPPLPLQQSFASRIEAIERQKELISNSIKESQKLFDSRMEYWFG